MAWRSSSVTRNTSTWVAASSSYTRWAAARAAASRAQLSCVKLKGLSDSASAMTRLSALLSTVTGSVGSPMPVRSYTLKAPSPALHAW